MQGGCTFKGDDTGKRDGKVQVYRAQRSVHVFDKTMHDPADLVCPFFFQDAQHVLLRLTAMDNQRLTHRSGRLDMTTEALALPVQIPLAAKIIEAGLTNGHHPGIAPMVDQLIDRDFFGHCRVRVDPDRGGDTVMLSGKFEQGRIGVHIYRDTQHLFDALLPRGLNDRRRPALHLDQRDMAMGINEGKRCAHADKS